MAGRRILSRVTLRAVPEDLRGRLRAMFDANREDAERHLPMYEFDAQLGAKPWWPPLCDVWRHQGQRPDWDDNAHWADAWRLLRALREAA